VTAITPQHRIPMDMKLYDKSGVLIYQYHKKSPNFPDAQGQINSTAYMITANKHIKKSIKKSPYYQK